MTFKKIHFLTYNRPETWEVDYRKGEIRTPGVGTILTISELIEWYRAVVTTAIDYMHQLRRIRELVGEDNWKRIERDWAAQKMKRGREA